MSKADIDSRWVTLHYKLTRLYYVEKRISKETFEKLHGAIWLLHEKESIAANILPNYIVDEVSGKIRFTEITEKLEEMGGETRLRKLLEEVLK